jgi:hypothetical protein
MVGRLLNLFGTPAVGITDGVLSAVLDGRGPGWRPLWTGGDVMPHLLIDQLVECAVFISR